MRIKAWAAVLGTCIVTIASLAAFKYFQISAMIAYAESFPERSESVHTVVAEEQLWSQGVTAVGEIVAVRSVNLRNELAGRITKLGFAPGATVEAGQLLLELDSSVEQAQLASAEAQAKLAELSLERFSQLLETKVSSKDQYDNAKAQQAIAEAQARELKTIISKKRIIAPFAAHTNLHTWEVGQYLPENTEIVYLTGISDELWLDFNLPQEYAYISVGTAVSVRAPGLIDTVITGEVIAKDASVMTDSRNIRFRALLKGVGARLTPGSLVEVSVELSSKPVVVVPSSAVGRDPAGPYVYILEPAEEGADGPYRAKQRRVKLGEERNRQFVVTQGLEVGELVASTGAYKLVENILTIPRNEVIAAEKRKQVLERLAEEKNNG